MVQQCPGTTCTVLLFPPLEIASVQPRADTSTMSVEAVEFEIDSQRYGLPLPAVVEIVRAVAIASLPKAPRVIEGVINWRGRVTPVLDARLRFGHRPRALDPSQHFILLRADSRVVAMRVDRATDIVTIDDADIEPLSASVPRAEYVAGVAKTSRGVVLIHDPVAFLTESESEALDQALERGGTTP